MPTALTAPVSGNANDPSDVAGEHVADTAAEVATPDRPATQRTHTYNTATNNM
jgi:hypothetical protein